MAQGAADFTMTIDGLPAGAATSLPVRNPATSEIFAHVPNAGQPELDAAVAAAAHAFPGFMTTS